MTETVIQERLAIAEKLIEGYRASEMFTDAEFWSDIIAALRQSDTRIEGGGEPVIHYDHNPSEIAEVYGADIIERIGIPAAWHGYVRLTVEQAIDHDRRKSRASAPPAPPVNISPTPEHVEGDVLSVGEMEARLRDQIEHVRLGIAARFPDTKAAVIELLNIAADTLTSATARIQRAERERDEILSDFHTTALALKAAEAQLADAVKVLEPFAAYVEERDKADADIPGYASVAAYATDLRGEAVRVTLDHFRAARAFLSTIGEKPDAE